MSSDVVDDILEAVKSGNLPHATHLLSETQAWEFSQILFERYGPKGVVEFVSGLLDPVIESGEYEDIERLIEAAFPYDPVKCFSLLARSLVRRKAFDRLNQVFLAHSEQLARAEEFPTAMLFMLDQVVSVSVKDAERFLAVVAKSATGQGSSVWLDYGRASLMVAEWRREEANMILERLRASECGDEWYSVVCQLLGENLLEMKKYAEAVSLYQEVIKRLTGNSEGYDGVIGGMLCLAESYLGLGRKADAAQMLERVTHMADVPEWAKDYAKARIGNMGGDI